VVTARSPEKPVDVVLVALQEEEEEEEERLEEEEKLCDSICQVS